MTITDEIHEAINQKMISADWKINNDSFNISLQNDKKRLIIEPSRGLWNMINSKFETCRTFTSLQAALSAA